jgi:hypothetical protein
MNFCYHLNVFDPYLYINQAQRQSNAVVATIPQGKQQNAM